MQRNTKDWIQYGSALGMLTSGALMSFLCFFLEQHQVNDSVLLYLAQCMVYAGSVFGVAVYVNTKIGDVRNYVDRKFNHDNTQTDE